MREENERVRAQDAVQGLLRAMRAEEMRNRSLHSETRVDQWMDALTSLGGPNWITPEARRTAATGEHAAGGPLRPHERERAAALGLPLEESTRVSLNADSLSAEGIARLQAQLREGTYRIGVPEEAALLVVAWLVEKGDLKSVEKLLELISARFGALRFYPQPGPTSLHEDAERPAFFHRVFFRSAEDIAASFDPKNAVEAIEAQHESITVWAPITDDFVTLLLEVFDVEQGKTCTELPPNFAVRRSELLRRYDEAVKVHERCKRPHKPGEVLRVLVDVLREADDPRQAAWSAQGRARTRLSDFLRRYGTPGSEPHRAYREAQAKASGIPYRRFAHVLQTRLATIPSGSGIEDFDGIAAPLNASEASTSKIPEGTELPLALRTHLQRAAVTALEEHLVEGRIVSSEALANTLPQLSSAAFAKGFDDVRIARLYAATHRAFKYRRAQLPPWRQYDAHFQQLPWVAAMEAYATTSARTSCKELLRSFTAFALEAFPSTVISNRLVAELQALAHVSFEAPLPLVEVVVPDPFNGKFTANVLQASQVAARLLGEESIYARYYGLPYNRVLTMKGADFDLLCPALADAPSGKLRARNGMVLEQASILTTHNLAVLVDALDLDVGFLAPRVFNDILDMLERKVLTDGTPEAPRLSSMRKLAFAWRQMLFFLSRAKPEEVTQWHADMHALLRERSALTQERFMPVMRGLDLVIAGGRLPRWDASAPRLLGWTTTRPFLFGPSA